MALERIEITGGEILFYFDDCPEAFTKEEFAEKSRTRMWMAAIESCVEGYNLLADQFPWQRDWQPVREVK